MKGTSRLAAAGVVLFTTLGLLGYLWANQLRLDVPGYGFIRPQAAGLSVRLGSHLV
jgi:GTP-binding protein EngB required for normal cell division